MMSVQVELFGQLLPGAPRRHLLLLEEATTAEQVALRLGLDLETVGLVVIDGVQSELDAAVPPGSRLCFFPPMSGG
jgi:molybdopterin converting factor small subunit